jgi:hypothetical protein
MKLDTRILSVLDEVERSLFYGHRYIPGMAIRSFISISKFFAGDQWPDGYELQLQGVMYFLTRLMKPYDWDDYYVVAPGSVVLNLVAVRVYRLWLAETGNVI